MGVEVIRVEDVTKTFHIHKQKSLKERLVNSRVGKLHEERFVALDQVKFTIEAGESVGLIGPNGSGKSTLLKIIGGILAPSSGQVLARGRIAALLELGAGFHPDLTGRENIYLNAAIMGLSTQETDKYLDSIIDFAGIPDFIDTQVKFYSSGMYVRLAFAVAVHVDPDILLVDEVLAVGDEPFQNKCMQKIHQFQDEGRTIIFVSHSAAQVAEVCSRAIVLEHGQVMEDATPQIALARLRKGYRQTVEDQEAAKPSAEDFARVFVEHSHLATDDGKTTDERETVIQPGSSLTATYHMNFSGPTPQWSVVLTISNSLDQAVAHYQSGTDPDTILPPAEGPWKTTVVIPQLWLGNGDYSLRMSVVNPSGTVIGFARDAMPFTVASDSANSGSVFVHPTITAKPL